ncbi:hypothetical protein DBR41_25940 [Pseudomonas sp. HMWF010]|uniref:thermostable hemolysin n=1 Tax=Caulobacter sp. HMWF009 TaxID=2056846 RepID=UPI000D3B282F|nr:thermostable hemolysin [Caulobacter sp. HMWF009]PTS87058.1 hypothetical protein DBR21_13705 [Caulobacter sp. HMWF009]PTT08988.1 hypothetical protein DBR10_07925 [Caulobacter sp. HMWF025]PTT75726.1 hypothetical protein DBR41_25940 [Pseudomonas sp. HMWF010]
MLEVMMLDDGAMRGSLRFDADRVRRFTSVEPRVISIHHLMQPERRRVEAYIERAYAQAFNGKIRRHYPTLMSVQDAAGQIHGAVGFRQAASGALFLEQYLDEPIEAAIDRKSGETVCRSSVAEIGSLASESAGASLFLFLALARHLHHKGCTHAAATATRQLRRSFARVGFATETLTRADAGRLGEGAADWGGYYQRDPEVMVGAIAPALPALAQMLMAEPPAVPDIHSRLHPAFGPELAQ